MTPQLRSDDDSGAAWPLHDHVRNDENGRSYIAGTFDPGLEPRSFAPPAGPFLVSAPIDVDKMLFFEVPAGWEGDWHPSPRAQYYVQLRGSLEVEFGSGETRIIGAGDLMRLEDTVGDGHRSRVVGDAPARGIFVQLADQPLG